MKNYTLNTMKRMRRGMAGICATLFALGLAVSGSAQTNVTFAPETGTAGWLPIYGANTYSYSQQIYYPANLGAVAGQQNLITKVRFYYVSGNAAPNNSWTVYMGNTSVNSYTTTYNSWIPTSAMTQVFTGTVTFPAANNWLEVTLATPFVWNGTSNLVVAVDENSATSNATVFQKSEVGSGRAIYYGSNFTNPDPASPPTYATGTHGHVPNIQFEMVPFAACTGTPVHYAATVNDNAICAGETVTLDLNDHGYSLASTGTEYIWQSNNGTGWVTIPGTANKSIQATPAITSQFRSILNCTNSSMRDTSDAITVTVNPLPVVTTNMSNYAICTGSSAALEASGADTYVWSPSTALDGTTTALVNANPTATTIYTVTGTTTATGCTNTATVKIFPVSRVVSESAFTPEENCTHGSPVAVTVSGLPSGISGAGAWEYRFMKNDGLTVLQNWSTNSTYSFIPGVDSVYNYFYQVRSNSCPDNRIDSTKVSIAIGFGAETDLVHYDCNTLGGTITLSQPFGQTEIMEIYSNSLGDPANLTGITTTGNASITGGRAVITPSALSNSGTVTVNPPAFTPGANNSMTISFDMTMDTPVNVGADGICYSFGNDALPTGAGSMQNGKGSKLRLSFDAIDNSTNNGNIEGAYLVYGWTSTTEFGPLSTGVLAFNNNSSLWKNKTDVAVVLTIDATGKATVTVDGTVLFANIQLPPAYMTADVTGWKHLFSAATGGYAFRQAVSNFSISAGSMYYGITPASVTTAPATWQPSQIFEDLAPGSYNIWMAKDETSACNKNIGTFEILNLNPVVDLGSDTTICDGEMLTLDAGNAGSTYVWSGTNIVTQTLEVDEAGSYVVYATDTSGCLGIGTINVEIAEAPSAAAIYAQGTYPTVFFAVTNPENVDTYDWNFGDNTTLDNAPSSVSHTYEEDGTYTVTATISNECGEVTLTKQVTIVNTASLAENTIEGLKVYPNPASDFVTISLDNAQTATVTVFSVSGVKVAETAAFNTKLDLNVQNWESGVYFLHIQTEGKTSVSKIAVN